MSALTAARDRINGVGADAELVSELGRVTVDADDVADPIELPDGKRIFPSRIHGTPVDEIACALLDMQDPGRSRFLQLIGPPGTGKSQIARAIAYKLWLRRGRQIEVRHGRPFYGFVELQPGPSSDEFFFRYDYVPIADRAGEVRLVDRRSSTPCGTAGW